MKSIGSTIWGKPNVYGKAEPTKFDKLLAKLGISLEEAERSLKVGIWARKHRHTNYVPEEILLAHGITTNFDE